MTLNEQAAQSIEDVLELIPDEDHWWRGTRATITGPSGRRNLCVVTALWACNAEPRLRAWNAIAIAADRCGITSWNDDPRTSFEDFRLALKRAAYSLRSEDGAS